MAERPGSRPTAPAAQPSPWPKRFGLSAGAGVVLLLVAVVAFSQAPPRGVPDGTERLAVGDPQHVEGDIHAQGDVPAGGTHDAQWQNCGFYDVPVRSENAVHSLEHGAVWITYRPALTEGEIDRLRSFTHRDDKILITPLTEQEAVVIATAWGTQLDLDGIDDPRLEQFVNEFEGYLGAPEPGGVCFGGVGRPVQ